MDKKNLLFQHTYTFYISSVHHFVCKLFCKFVFLVFNWQNCFGKKLKKFSGHWKIYCSQTDDNFLWKWTKLQKLHSTKSSVIEIHGVDKNWSVRIQLFFFGFNDKTQFVKCEHIYLAIIHSLVLESYSIRYRDRVSRTWRRAPKIWTFNFLQIWFCITLVA